MAIKKLLVAAICIQLVFLGSIGLSKLGVGIPALRQVTGILYLSLVPGGLVLILFRFPRLFRAETLVYAAGLSLVLLMAVGVLANTLYPLFGISRPISELPLLVTLGIINFALGAVTYRHVREAPGLAFPQLKQITLFALPVLLLIPLSVLGAALLTFDDNKLGLLVFFGLVSILPILVTFNRLPEGMHLPLIWAISLGLLWGTTLVGTILPVEGDVGNEFYWAHRVLNSGIWEAQISVSTNSMLRTTILLPFYAVISGLDMISVIKIVQPLLYSLTPVIMYLAFRSTWNPRVAFLSSFLYMAFYTFYVVMARNGRTSSSEFLLSLLLLAMVDRSLTLARARLLAILFSLSIIVSHYGTSHLVLVNLFIAALLSWLLTPHRQGRFLTFGLAFTYFVANMTWYMFTASSTVFKTAVSFFREVWNSVITLGGFGQTYSMYTLTRSWAPSSSMTLYLLMVMGILVSLSALGIGIDLVRRRKTALTPDMSAFFLTMYLLFMSQFLPVLGQNFGPALVSHIALTVIAPLFVMGTVAVGGVLSKVLGGYKALLGEGNCLKVVAAFLTVFFLLNSGFVAEVFTKGSDYAPNVLISKAREETIADPTFTHAVGRVFFYEGEALSGNWLGQHREPEQRVYLDRETENLLSTYGRMGPWYLEPGVSPLGYEYEYRQVNFVKDSHLFLRHRNYVRGVSMVTTLYPSYRLTRLIYELDDNKSKVYDNGESAIYFVSFGAANTPLLRPRPELMKKAE